MKKSLLLEDAFLQFITDKKPTTTKTYKHLYTKFFSEKFATANILNCRERNKLVTYVKKINNVSISTISALLRAIFRDAISRYNLTFENPIKILKKAKSIHEGISLSNDQINQVLDCLRKNEEARLLLLFLVAIYTGQRISTILSMQKSDFTNDLSVWHISAANTKNARPHKVHICDYLREELHRNIGQKSGYVFSNSSNKKVPIHKDTAHRILKNFLQKNELPQFTWHDCRRTFITHMATKHSVYVARELVGINSVRVLEQHYIKIADNNKKNAMNFSYGNQL